MGRRGVGLWVLLALVGCSNNPYPDADNALMEAFGEANGDCLVVFREQTAEGPHYFRFSDLNRDDHDVRLEQERRRGGEYARPA